MAYQIIGQVHIIGQTEQITSTKTGSIMQKRTLTLMQRRYDPNTGEEFTPNFPQLEFSGQNCAKLDQFRQGDRVLVKFEVNGTTWNDKNTGEVKFMTRLRAFNIEHYVQQQPQAPAQPQYATAPQQPQQYPQQPVQHQQQPAQQYPQQQPPQQQHPPQQGGGYPPQDPNLPF